MKATFEEFANAIKHLSYEVKLEWKNSDFIWSATLTTEPIEFAGIKSQVYSSILIRYISEFDLAIEIRSTDKNKIRIHSTASK